MDKLTKIEIAALGVAAIALGYMAWRASKAVGAAASSVADNAAATGQVISDAASAAWNALPGSDTYPQNPDGRQLDSGYGTGASMSTGTTTAPLGAISSNQDIAGGSW